MESKATSIKSLEAEVNTIDSDSSSVMNDIYKIQAQDVDVIEKEQGQNDHVTMDLLLVSELPSSLTWSSNLHDISMHPLTLLCR